MTTTEAAACPTTLGAEADGAGTPLDRNVQLVLPAPFPVLRTATLR